MATHTHRARSAKLRQGLAWPRASQPRLGVGRRGAKDTPDACLTLGAAIAGLGFGRIVVSETEAPNMFVNLV